MHKNGDKLKKIDKNKRHENKIVSFVSYKV